MREGESQRESVRERKRERVRVRDNKGVRVRESDGTIRTLGEPFSPALFKISYSSDSLVSCAC